MLHRNIRFICNATTTSKRANILLGFLDKATKLFHLQTRKPLLDVAPTALARLFSRPKKKTQLLLLFSLVAGSGTDSVLTGRSGVQGSTWRCSTLPRSADPCQRLAWSMNTPFYQCQPPGTSRQTVNSRQPSLCGCGSTHLEYTAN